MKQLLLLISLAVLGLSCNQQAQSDKTQTAGRVVYVNTDTLLNNYDFYKDVQKEFENRGFALENELKKKSESFQNEVSLFQRRVQAGGMTQSQAETTQQQLQKKEQDILLYRDNAAGALQQEQAAKMDEILTNIQDYLATYNTDDKYDMVIGYSKGGGVLYAKENLEITQEVLVGLNKEYNSEGEDKSKEETMKGDSTKVK